LPYTGTGINKTFALEDLNKIIPGDWPKRELREFKSPERYCKFKRKLELTEGTSRVDSAL
jgi:hypothetical protein